MTTTTTNTVSAPLTYLHRIIPALAPIASTDPNRGALTGIYMTPADENHPARLTVTDAYRMVEVTPDPNHYTHSGPAVILTARTLAAAVKAAHKAAERHRRNEAATVTIEIGGAYLDTITGRTNLDIVSHEYPRTASLWPDPTTTPAPFEPVGIDPDLLAGLAESLSKIAPGATIIQNHYAGPCKPLSYTVASTDDATTARAILMPRRTTK